MHATIYNEFRAILSQLKITGPILEIGAVPEENTLLNIDLLRARERIGINIAPASSYNGFDILQASATDLSVFKNGHFDCVLSNATIEHEKQFWKICAEIRRVLRPGGVAIVGAPGYSRTGDTGHLTLSKPAAAFPASAAAGADPLAEWDVTTLVYRYHGAPKDYYRFSEDAFREVIFEGYRDVCIRTVMVPPRLIGSGIKAV
jgi:SAM-dependent methyltransferase